MTLDLFIHPFPLVFFPPVVWNFPFYTSCPTCLSYSTDIFTNVPLLLPEYRSSACLLERTEHLTGSHRGLRGGQRDGRGRLPPAHPYLLVSGVQVSICTSPILSFYVILVLRPLKLEPCFLLLLFWRALSLPWRLAAGSEAGVGGGRWNRPD